MPTIPVPPSDPASREIEVTKTRGTVAMVLIVLVTVLQLLWVLSTPKPSADVLAHLDELAEMADMSTKGISSDPAVWWSLDNYVDDYLDEPTEYDSFGKPVGKPDTEVSEGELRRAADQLGTWAAFGVFVGVVALAASVAFVVWLWRARTVAGALIGRPMEWGRPWTVVSWFIPIANLFLPYFVVAEVRDASRPEDEKLGRGLPLCWWGFWVVTWVASFVTSNDLAMLFGVPEPSRTFGNVMSAGLLMGFAGVPAAIFAVMIIRRIDQWQLAAASRRSLRAA